MQYRFLTSHENSLFCRCTFINFVTHLVGMCMTGGTRFRLMEKSDADFDVHLDSWNEVLFRHCLETENVGSAHLSKRKLVSYAALWLYATRLHIPHMLLIFFVESWLRAPGPHNLTFDMWHLSFAVYSWLHAWPLDLTSFLRTPYSHVTTDSVFWPLTSNFWPLTSQPWPMTSLL